MEDFAKFIKPSIKIIQQYEDRVSSLASNMVEINQKICQIEDKI
jgi:hypothetical protein